MEEVAALLSGQPTARPRAPDPRAQDMKVELFHNVCYIVCAVIMEGDRVLMIQEAKKSCRGKWYLPAGRMERNETIVEAVKREVKEESGFDFEPETVLCVECHAHSWVRFTLGGRRVGGALKTVADQESLQAQWQPAEKTELHSSVELRSDDILKLIAIATEWYTAGKPCKWLPVGVGHTSCSLRLVVVRETGSGGLECLVRKPEERGTTGLPVCLFDHSNSIIQTAVEETLKGCGFEDRSTRVVGVVSIEHVGERGRLDGFCLSLLVHVATCGKLTGAGWGWEEVKGEWEQRLKAAAREGPSHCAKLIDLTSHH